MKTIAIIGNSGTSARPWTLAFLAAGWRVRSLVRDPDRAKRLPSLTPVAFDFDDRGCYEPAVSGVDLLALRRRPKTGELGWAFYWRGLFAGFQSPGLKVNSP